jgi:hypothetical protein
LSEPRAFPCGVGARRCRALKTVACTRVPIAPFVRQTSPGVVGGGLRTAPYNGHARAPRCSLAERIRLDARIVGATRCVALAPLCTSAPHELMRSQCTRRTQWATHRVAPTLPAGGAQDRMYHARSGLASRRVRCIRGTPTLPGDPIAGSHATWRVVGGGLRTAPYNGQARAPRCSLAERIRLDARIVGATRCVALAPLCTPAPHEPTRSQCTRRTERATHRVAPTLPAGRVCLVERADRTLPACSQRGNKETPLPGRERPARSAG